MFWELNQQRAIADARGSAAAAENKADQTREYIRMLEGRVDKLQLACQAMWELMRDMARIDEDRLLAKIQEIDLRDGKADGKMSSSGVACDGCQRPVHARHQKCLYCGKELTRAHSFHF